MLYSCLAQVTNKFNVLINIQKNSDKVSGYCNVSALRLNLSRALLNDLTVLHTILTASSEESEPSLECSPLPVDLWSQKKIVRDRRGQQDSGKMDLCRTRCAQAYLRRYSFSLNLEAASTRVFFLDTFCSPVLASKFKTEGILKISRSCGEFQGVTAMECVMYNSRANQWERLLEPGPGGQPAKMNISIESVNMTQVHDNMEEIPIVTDGKATEFAFYS